MSGHSQNDTFQERRQSLKLRLLYPEISAHLRSIFRLRPDWAGTSIDFIALRAIHERYQDLSSHEVRSLATAAARNPRLAGNASRLVA